MNDKTETKVLTLANEYRERLQGAQQPAEIRERMEWYRKTGASLFSSPRPDTSNSGK